MMTQTANHVHIGLGDAKMRSQFARRLAAATGVAAVVAMGAITIACDDQNSSTETTTTPATETTGTDKSIISSVESWISSASRRMNPTHPGPGVGGIRGG